MLWGMELSFAEEEILRKYLPVLKKYKVYPDGEICELIETCNNDLESRIQAFIGWFLTLEYRALTKSEQLNLPDGNEILFRALNEEWKPTEFQKKMLMESGLYSFELAMREKLAQINFFKAIAYNIPRSSNRIQFLYRGQVVWDAMIPELLNISNRGLIEMYKFQVNRHRENLKTANYL